jgi:hypothetical protein
MTTLLRLTAIAVLAAIAVVLPASSAMAFNTGTPPGPPAVSGGLGAAVFHCADPNVVGTTGVIVFNSNGISGTPSCLAEL